MLNSLKRKLSDPNFGHDPWGFQFITNFFPTTVMCRRPACWHCTTHRYCASQHRFSAPTATHLANFLRQCACIPQSVVSWQGCDKLCMCKMTRLCCCLGCKLWGWLKLPSTQQTKKQAEVKQNLQPLGATNITPLQPNPPCILASRAWGKVICRMWDPNRQVDFNCQGNFA